MNKILLFFLIIFPAWGFSQQYHAGDTLYVWNINGTFLFQKPSFSSSVLDSLKLGSPVIVNTVPSQKNRTKKIVNHAFPLKGYWIQVLAGNKTGYVFGGDCFPMNPLPVNLSGDKEPLIQRVLGKKTDYKVVVKKFKLGHDTTTYSQTEKITFFENGRETTSWFDGCDDDEYIFYHASLSRIYHLMMLMLTFDINGNNHLDIFDQPRLRGVWGGVYEFDGVGATDANMQVVKDGVRLNLSSCD